VGDNYLSNTAWRINSGAWQVKEDADGKWIECMTSGVLYQPSPQAYGTWEFDVNKVPDTATTIIAFNADVAGAWNAPGQDGYFISLSSSEKFTLQKLTNGAAAILGITGIDYVAIDTWYTIRVTRRYDGQFTAYIRGGALAKWTLIDVSGGSGSNPVIDASHTSTKYIILDTSAGAQIRNLKTYFGVVPPL